MSNRNKQTLAFTRSLECIYGSEIAALACLDERIEDGRIDVKTRAIIFKLFCKVKKHFDGLGDCYDLLPNTLLKDHFINRAKTLLQDKLNAVELSMVYNFITAIYKMRMK